MYFLIYNNQLDKNFNINFSININNGQLKPANAYCYEKSLNKIEKQAKKSESKQNENSNIMKNDYQHDEKTKLIDIDSSFNSLL